MCIQTEAIGPAGLKLRSEDETRRSLVGLDLERSRHVRQPEHKVPVCIGDRAADAISRRIERVHDGTARRAIHVDDVAFDGDPSPNRIIGLGVFEM